MRTDLPDGIVQSMHDLSPEELVVLYRVVLQDASVINLSPYETITWLGNEYSSLPCTMSSIERDSDGKVNRPKFSFANPGAVFNGPIYDGRLDNARITRFRLQKSDLTANNDFKITETFYVSKIVTLTKYMAMLELRDIFDGPTYFLPPRAYYPPEFPHVQLQ